jgi:hypothetical protein
MGLPFLRVAGKIKRMCQSPVKAYPKNKLAFANADASSFVKFGRMETGSVRDHIRRAANRAPQLITGTRLISTIRSSGSGGAVAFVAPQLPAFAVADR